MNIAGIGCRQGASADDISRAISAALERCGLSMTDIDALAIDAAKSAEAGVLAAAETLALPIVLVSETAMKGAADRTLTTSPRVVALKGVPSVAETAALAAAGQTSRLLGPRVANETATCAIATGNGP